MPAHRSPPSAALRDRSPRESPPLPARVGTFACASRHLRRRGTRRRREHSPFPQDRGAALRQTPVHAARRPEGTAVSAMPDSSDFRSPYRHGFLRVAACTLRTVDRRPRRPTPPPSWRRPASAPTRASGSSIFPELTLTGYSIEDLLLQDTLLDAAEAALAEVVAASADLLPVLVVGAPAPRPAPDLQLAAVVHRGRLLGVAPKSYLPTYREFYERRQVAPGDDRRGTIHGRRRRGAVRAGPAVRGRGRARVRAARRDLRGHVGADPAQRRGRAGRRDRAGEPVRQSDHDRPGRGPRPAGAVGVVALPGGLRLRRGRRGRVVHRPRLGRPDDDLRERRPARRDRALPEGPAALGRRRRPRPAAAERLRMGTFDDNRAPSRRPHRAASGPWRSGSTRPAATSGCGASVERFPFVPADPTRLAQDCYEAYNIQVAGLEQRLRAIGQPKVVIGVSGGLDSTHALIVAAQGDGPREPPAHRHPRRSPCRASPPASRTKGNALRLTKALGSPSRSSTSPRPRG